jgi:hypothetical protein
VVYSGFQIEQPLHNQLSVALVSVGKKPFTGLFNQIFQQQRIFSVIGFGAMRIQYDGNTTFRKNVF